MGSETQIHYVNYCKCGLLELVQIHAKPEEDGTF